MASIEGQHIFIVDDELRVCEVICETLEKSGYKVRCFVRASKCLEQLRSQRCDLLITDLKMPEMGGVELLRHAKRLTPWLPVLIITGYGDVPTAVKAMKAGAVDFIEKPLVKESFLRKVKSLLQQGASANTCVGKPLTRSETRVLKLIIAGKNNREIADLFNRSVRTVEVQRARVMEKLGVDSLVDLIKQAVAMGLVDVPANQEPASDDAASER